MARWTYLFLLLTTLLIAGAVDAAPMRMSQINSMIDGGASPAQVIESMREHGVGFRMTSTAERRLKSYGFSDEQIATVKRIIDGTDVPPQRDGVGEGEGGEGAQPPVPGQPFQDRANAPVDGEFPVGYVFPDDFHAAEKYRVERAVADSLGYRRIELSRVTIYCSDRRARRLVPMLQELEKKLIDTFPDSLSNASDPRSAHIVIVDGAAEWGRWIDACFKSYEQDGIDYSFGPGIDRNKHLKAGPGYMLPHLAAVHADKLPNDELVGRFAAYDVGHLMMVPASAGGPSSLITGFGDFAEALAFGNPSVTVYSYVEREGEAATMSWLQIVQQRFKDGQIRSAHRVWSYTTAEMVLHEYAEAWSLVTTLAQAPDKFAKAVRLKQMGATMPEAIEQAYELDDRKLTEAWFKFVNQ